MLRIRLRRTGQKHQPSYRVVVADRDSPRDGRFVEILGHYNPRTEPSTFEVNEERMRYWLGQGAQPSETVHRLLHRRGMIEVEPPTRTTRPSRAEREAAEAAARAAAEERAAAAEAAAAADSAAAAESAAETADAAEGEPEGGAEDETTA